MSTNRWIDLDPIRLIAQKKTPCDSLFSGCRLVETPERRVAVDGLERTTFTPYAGSSGP
jgi:hypothetical protein